MGQAIPIRWKNSAAWSKAQWSDSDLGYGLGSQLLAQAYGAELAPMEVGHFGLNIPVREIATGKIEITSQNHLYSIARDSLPHDLLVTHENVNDHSIEAFRHRYQPILGVQFQVDASPGPRENLYFYDEFLEVIDAKIHESRREKEWWNKTRNCFSCVEDSYQDISLLAAVNEAQNSMPRMGMLLSLYLGEENAITHRKLENRL